MRHEYRGDAEPLLDVADLEPHLVAQLGVEVGQGLIKQQDARPDDQRASQRHPLLLPAGHFLGLREPYPGKRTISSASSTRAWISALPTPRISRPKATFCAADMCGNKA